MAFVEPECFWETCHISDLRPGKQPPCNGLWTCPKIKAFSVPRNLPDINRLPAFQLSSATRGRAADIENSFSASLCLSFLSLLPLYSCSFSSGMLWRSLPFSVIFHNLSPEEDIMSTLGGDSATVWKQGSIQEACFTKRSKITSSVSLWSRRRFRF